MSDMKENNKNPKLDPAKGSGFNVPRGYFETFDDQLSNQLSNLEDGMPDKMKHGFTVPDGYFDEEPDGLQLDRPVGQKRVINLFSKKAISLSIAASILIFIGIKTLSQDAAPASISDYSSEELLSWLETDASDVNSYDIAEVFDNLSVDEEYYSDEIILDYVADSDLEELLIEN